MGVLAPLNWLFHDRRPCPGQPCRRTSLPHTPGTPHAEGLPLARGSPPVPHAAHQCAHQSPNARPGVFVRHGSGDLLLMMALPSWLGVGLTWLVPLNNVAITAVFTVREPPHCTAARSPCPTRRHWARPRPVGSKRAGSANPSEHRTECALHARNHVVEPVEGIRTRAYLHPRDSEAGLKTPVKAGSKLLYSRWWRVPRGLQQKHCR